MAPAFINGNLGERPLLGLLANSMARRSGDRLAQGRGEPVALTEAGA